MYDTTFINPDFKLCEKCPKYRVAESRQRISEGAIRLIEKRMCGNMVLGSMEWNEPHSWVNVPNDCPFMLEQLLSWRKGN